MNESMPTKKSLLLSSFYISLLFSTLDGLVHYFFEPLEIYYYPLHYFGITYPLANYALSKLVSTTILLFIIFYLFGKTKLGKYTKYISITLIVIILLELRYILSGQYTPTWHLYNFINHFVTLFVAMYVVGWTINRS